MDHDAIIIGPGMGIDRRGCTRTSRQSKDAYYSSDEWRLGPLEAKLALIENYTDIVLELDEVTV